MYRTYFSVQLLAISSLFALFAGFSSAADSPLGRQCSVPLSRDFAGAPPAFVKPVGGSEEVESTPLGYACTLRRPDGSLFGRALFEEGRVARVEYYRQTNRVFFAQDIDYATSVGKAPDGPRRATRRLHPLASCGGDARNPYAYTWIFTIEWYLNYASLPGYINKDLTETNLRNAHIEWEQNQNWCGIADSTTLNFTYKGRTTLSVGRNGVNTVGWGRCEDFGYDSSILGCTLNWYNDAYGWPDESDVRMDEDHLWQNGTSASGRWDVWHVYAHELGHTAQFGHVSDPSNVMYNQMGYQQTSNRLLGRGDANENNAKY
jgi:hypothetical protein